MKKVVHIWVGYAEEEEYSWINNKWLTSSEGKDVT